MFGKTRNMHKYIPNYLQNLLKPFKISHIHYPSPLQWISWACLGLVGPPDLFFLTYLGFSASLFVGGPF